MMQDYASKPVDQLDPLELVLAYGLASFEEGMAVGQHANDPLMVSHANWNSCPCQIAQAARDANERAAAIFQRLNRFVLVAIRTSA